MPDALCPVPYALCPMLYALCALRFASAEETTLLKLQTISN